MGKMEVPALLMSRDSAHLLKPRRTPPAQSLDSRNLSIAVAKVLLYLSSIKQKMHMQ